MFFAKHTVAAEDSVKPKDTVASIYTVAIDLDSYNILDLDTMKSYSNQHYIPVTLLYFTELQYPDYNLCTGRYGYCHASSECESGVVCKQTFTEKKCCTSPYSQCPTVDELGYTCLQRHPTNW